MTIIDEIENLFATKGDSEYGGEAVSQREHALQAAAAAVADGANEPLVAAALLHDVGHLLHDLPADSPEAGIDDHHENSAARFLESHFGPEVSEPVRLHVAAKRYLTAVEPDYMPRLSDPSVTSLFLQGGPMSPAEQEAFRQSPHWQSALRLRRYDEAAKVAGAATPALADFLPLLARVAASSHPLGRPRHGV